MNKKRESKARVLVMSQERTKAPRRAPSLTPTHDRSKVGQTNTQDKPM